MPLYTSANRQLPLPNEMSKADKEGRNEAEAFKPNIVSKSFSVTEFEDVKAKVSAHLQKTPYRGFYMSEGGEGSGLVLRVVMLHTDEANSFVRQLNRALKDEGAFKLSEGQTRKNQEAAKKRIDTGFQAASSGLSLYFGQQKAAVRTKRVVDYIATSDSARVTRQELVPSQ